MFISSILAGISIGIAAVLFCLAPNPIIGAGLFALGLLNVLLMKYHLVTGKFQHFGTQYGFADLGKMLTGNVLGVSLVALVAMITLPQVATTATGIATAKIAMPLLTTFGKAILCGYIMTVATRPNTPLWVSALGVFAFVYTGLNHCVADAFYYVSNNSSLLPFWITVFGNAIGGKLGGITPPQ